MSEFDSKPWYKQAWPWVLISLPIISVIVNMVLISLALDTEDTLVVDDYYKKGKGINQELSRVEYAKRLGVDLEINIRDTSVELIFLDYEPTDRTALTLSLRHKTLASKDQIIALTSDASGVYRGKLKSVPVGKWSITVEPFDKQWKVQETRVIANNSQLRLTP